MSPVKGPGISDENTHTFQEKQQSRVVNKTIRTPTILNKYCKKHVSQI